MIRALLVAAALLVAGGARAQSVLPGGPGLGTDGGITNLGKLVSRYVLASPATVDGVRLRFGETAGGVKWKAVIYADAAGVPGAFVAATPEQTGITDNVDRDVSFSAPVELAAGTYYVGVHTDTFHNMQGTAGAFDRWGTMGDTYSDGPSDPFGSATDYNNASIAVALLGTTAGGASSPSGWWDSAWWRKKG